MLSHFDKTDESQAQIQNTSLKGLLIKNLDIAANEGKIERHSLHEYSFGFCRSFRKTTKQLGFHLTFKSSDLQDNIYTTLGEDNEVIFEKLFLYGPIFIPNAETLIMFYDSIKNSFILSCDSRSTPRKTVDTLLKNQVDDGSAQNNNSPKYLIAAH